MADQAPRIYVEPPIPLSTEISDVYSVRGIIRQLDIGIFRQPALLLERMLWNPRLRAVVETRLAGVIASDIRFKPARNNKDCRRAAKELAQDWPLMMSAPMRKQMAKSGLFLGLGVGQRVLDKSPITGRAVFKLRPYWTGFAQWYWAARCYRIQTFDVGVTDAQTPSLDPALIKQSAYSSFLGATKKPSETPWVISEPFGMNSYREGLMHAAWRPWLGHEWSMRDQARASEKYGIGVLKAKYPRGSGDEHKAAIERYTRGLRSLGSEGVIPLEQRSEGEANFDVETLEYTGTGFQCIADTMNSNAVALAILLLGHNLTTEIKGGGSYAAAGVGEYIRDDKKRDDSDIEKTWAEPQIIAPWAEANYGDPSVAPVLEYVTDSPTVNLHRAQMINSLAMATQYLRANVPRVDCEALAEQFDLPMLDESVTVQVPAAPTAAPAQPAPAKEPTQENDE